MSDQGMKTSDFRHMDVKNGRLYWGGEEVVTKRRLADTERWFVGIGLALTAIGVVATCVQAWFAAFPPVHLP